VILSDGDVILEGMLELNPEIAKRRIIRRLRDLKRMNAERRRSDAERQLRQEEEDSEMREIFAMTAALAKDMGMEFEIPPEWR
jgi:hypothetical protein